MRGHSPWSKAALAALTAKSTSSLSASATLAMTPPVRGSLVSNVLPEQHPDMLHSVFFFFCSVEKLCAAQVDYAEPLSSLASRKNRDRQIGVHISVRFRLADPEAESLMHSTLKQSRHAKHGLVGVRRYKI
jgi:hypothetical protein